MPPGRRRALSKQSPGPADEDWGCSGLWGHGRRTGASVAVSKLQSCSISRDSSPLAWLPPLLSSKGIYENLAKKLINGSRGGSYLCPKGWAVVGGVHQPMNDGWYFYMGWSWPEFLAPTLVQPKSSSLLQSRHRTRRRCTQSAACSGSTTRRCAASAPAKEGRGKGAQAPVPCSQPQCAKLV